jgi:hypothetical protein
MTSAVIARFKRAIQYPPALEVKFGLSIQTGNTGSPGQAGR